MGCACSDEPDPVQPIIINPQQSATEQATFNKDAAVQQRSLNMVDQYTPQGSTEFRAKVGEDGEPLTYEGIPQMEVHQTLSPTQQALYDTSNQMAQKYGEIGNTQLDAVRGSLETPFSMDQFGAAPVVNEATRQATRDAMVARNQPLMDRDREALRTSLVNQGFETGSEGYDQAFDQANRARNDFYLATDAQAGNEMARMYGLESNAYDRGISNALLERNQPLTELASFMTGSQPQGPQFLPTPQGQVAAPDFMGAEFGAANQQNQFNQNQYNQQMGAYNASNAGLYQLGGAAIGAGGYKWGQSSDRRLKRNIKRVGVLDNGLPVYSYNFANSATTEIGLMSDDVRAVRPHAVKSFGGYDRVKYSEAVK